MPKLYLLFGSSAGLSGGKSTPESVGLTVPDCCFRCKVTMCPPAGCLSILTTRVLIRKRPGCPSHPLPESSLKLSTYDCRDSERKLYRHAARATIGDAIAYFQIVDIIDEGDVVSMYTFVAWRYTKVAERCELPRADKFSVLISTAYSS